MQHDVCVVACVDGRLEGGVIHLEERALLDLRVHKAPWASEPGFLERGARGKKPTRTLPVISDAKKGNGFLQKESLRFKLLSSSTPWLSFWATPGGLRTFDGIAGSPLGCLCRAWRGFHLKWPRLQSAIIGSTPPLRLGSSRSFRTIKARLDL